jgi:hypothetical protein
MTDNLRIWAERLAGAAPGALGRFPGTTRTCSRTGLRVCLPSRALWSLQRAARDWQEAINLGLRQDLVLVHAGRGQQRAPDVARNNAHDA